MERLRRYVSRHGIALACSIVVGTLCVLPQFLAPLALGGGYKGLEFLYIDDELTYRSLIHEVLDGHPMVTSPHLYEYKDSPAIVYPIGDYFYAIPALVFGLACVIIASKFLFPALLFFLVYLFIRKLTGGEGYAAIANAIAIGLMVTLGMELIDIHYLKGLLSGSIHTTHLILWTRLVNPITGSLLVFGLLVSLWNVVEKGRKSDIVLAGILAAGTVGYFFSLAISLSLLAACIVVFLFQKKWTEAKRVLSVLFITLLLQAPYWYQTLHALGGEAGRKLEGRNGMFFTHAPMWNKLLIATSIFVVFSFFYAYVFKKKKEIFSPHVHAWSFIFTLMLASWMVFNEQVITGREIWPYHFVQYTIPFCFIMFFTTSYLVWRNLFPRLWIYGVLLISLIALYSGVSSAGSYMYRISDFKKLQQSAPALAFLNHLPQKDCVVLVTDFDKTLERLIPAYTRCDVYSSGYAFYGIPEDRLLHNYLLSLRMNGVTAEGIDKFLDTHDGEVRSMYSENWTQAFSITRDAWLTGHLEDVSRQYKEFLKSDLETQLKEYRVDYIFSSTELTGTVLKELSDISPATILSGVYIYATQPK